MTNARRDTAVSRVGDDRVRNTRETTARSLRAGSRSEPSKSASPEETCQERQASCAHPPTILLIDSDEAHARLYRENLVSRGLHVEHVPTVPTAIARVKQAGFAYEVVIVNISDRIQPWLQRLELLQEAAFQSASPTGPFLLCISTKRDSQFEFQVQLMGGELVYEE